MAILALVDADLVAFSASISVEKAVWSAYFEGELLRSSAGKADLNAWLKVQEFDLTEIEFLSTPTLGTWFQVKFRINALLRMLQNRTQADRMELILSSNTSYRKDKYPSYKAHRKAAKPIYYEAAVEYLVKEKEAVIAPPGLEGDDWLGVRHYENYLSHTVKAVRTIVCTKDKDLKMIPGLLYSWHRDEMLIISPAEANKWFYTQLLMGDAADNIKGLYRVGEVKSTKWLEEIAPDEYEEFVLRKYQEEWGDISGLEMFKMNKELLWIRRTWNAETPDFLGPRTGEML